MDDRLSRSLTQPYIVAGTNDTYVYVQALDDGTDEKDRYAGDRLFVGRLEVPADVELEIRVTDVVPQGEPVEVRTLVLASGITKDLTIALDAPEVQEAGPTPEPPTPDAGTADRIRAVRLAPKMGAWPSGGAGTLGAGALLLFAIGGAFRGGSRRVERELQALADTLRGLGRQ
ncbi:MAG: hypothetical protein GY913_20085 [Proteobacteria bacterium]|nr:hypothetical protein [Pseudomonadota bacterium]MCP4919206.1 hypothetical protein [Pseudomonadota bacterium]